MADDDAEEGGEDGGGGREEKGKEKETVKDGEGKKGDEAVETEEEDPADVDTDAVRSPTTSDGGDAATTTTITEGGEGESDEYADMLEPDEMGGFMAIDGVFVPPWKHRDKYIADLRAIIAEFLPYIRFSLLPPHYLRLIEEEGFVPHTYIHEVLSTSLSFSLVLILYLYLYCRHIDINT